MCGVDGFGWPRELLYLYAFLQIGVHIFRCVQALAWHEFCIVLLMRQNCRHQQKESRVPCFASMRQLDPFQGLIFP